MNVRSSKQWMVSIALTFALGACGGQAVGTDQGEVDAELTAQEVALLPAPEQEAEDQRINRSRTGS